MTDSVDNNRGDNTRLQTPESLREQLVEMSVLVNDEDNAVYREFEMGELEALITAATLAAQKALLTRVFDKYIADGSTGLADIIDAELAALERQQLGEESSDE